MKPGEEYKFEKKLEKKIGEQLSQERENTEKAISIQKEELLKENEVLRNELAELQKIIEAKSGKRITANRQLLLLHYLGFLDNFQFPSKEKRYNLFHIIIDKTRQSVKSFFNYREQPKTEEYKKIFNADDLFFVSDFLYEVGLSDKAKKVDYDMSKIKQ